MYNNSYHQYIYDCVPKCLKQDTVSGNERKEKYDCKEI